jgi:molybdate transport repressor ModE-like protein
VLDPLRLRLLLEVERLGSITKAAAACSIGQPTASTHLRTLESAVGHRLFERAGRATRLTDAGRVLARHAAMVLASLESLEDDLETLRGAHAGTLSVASCESFATYVASAALAQFARDRPHVEIDVRVAPSGEVVRLVADGEAHLGIAGRTWQAAGTEARHLLRDELVWIAPTDDALPRHLGPEHLERLTVIAPGPQSAARALTENALSRAGCEPARLLRVDSIETIKRMVAGGAGVAAVARLAVVAELQAGTLREVDLPGGGPEAFVLNLVSNERRTATPLERAFEYTLRQHCMPRATNGTAACAR